MRLRIDTRIDSMPPFDGERYCRWEVRREITEDDSIVLALGWASTKGRALQIARAVRREIKAGR